MTLNEAVKTRILELADKNHESLTSLCLNSDLTPSTIFNFIYGKTKIPQVNTIHKICLYCNITLNEFFDTPYFKNLKKD